MFVLFIYIIYRRKRDVEVSALFDHVQDDFDTRENEVYRTNFHDIYESDSNWCGLRLTCELAAKAGSILDKDEKMILSYFK